MRVLVIGAYGFIGSALARRLHAAGHAVTGLGRDLQLGRRLLPAIGWRAADLTELQTAQAWLPWLADVDVVVNAAGALQSSGRDDVVAVHDTAIRALTDACEAAGIQRLVQVSAPATRADASTAFMRSKAAADAHIHASRLDWVILRPGLVIGRDAYGGSALLRALAVQPGLQALVYGDRPVQTVALDDVADTVLAAVEGVLPAGTDVDLVEDRPRPLREVVAALRAWLGMAPPRWQLDVPAAAAAGVARIADALGRLGWRSPLRSTALAVLGGGVTGDPGPLRGLTGRSRLDLQQTLERQPATVQERWFARSYLLMPLVLGCLSLFWLLSGAIGLARVEAAAGVLDGTAAAAFAPALVVGGALLDIALGLGVLVRRHARRACLGMVLLTIAYLAAGTLLTPQLWLDPLGVFVKTLPGMVLALVGLVMLESR